MFFTAQSYDNKTLDKAVNKVGKLQRAVIIPSLFQHNNTKQHCINIMMFFGEITNFLKRHWEVSNTTKVCRMCSSLHFCYQVLDLLLQSLYTEPTENTN